GHLHSKHAHAAASAINKNFLSRLNISPAKSLKSGQRGDRNGCRCFERHVRRLQYQLLFNGAHILGKRASSKPKDFMSGLKLLYGRTHRFNTTGEVTAERLVSGCVPSSADEAEEQSRER